MQPPPPPVITGALELPGGERPAHIRLPPPVLTVSDEPDEVQHRLVQTDSAEHHRFEVPVLEGAHQADGEHRLSGHVPLEAAERSSHSAWTSRWIDSGAISRAPRRFLLRVRRKGRVAIYRHLSGKLGIRVSERQSEVNSERRDCQ